jgi:hypothetical protein
MGTRERELEPDYDMTAMFSYPSPSRRKCGKGTRNNGSAVVYCSSERTLRIAPRENFVPPIPHTRRRLDTAPPNPPRVTLRPPRSDSLARGFRPSLARGRVLELYRNSACDRDSSGLGRLEI